MHYRAACGYRGKADICVGQLAAGNEISAQIMFHTSLDSPATLSQLNTCRRYVRLPSLNNPLHPHTHGGGRGGDEKVRSGLESHSGFANKRTKEDGCSLTN